MFARLYEIILGNEWEMYVKCTGNVWQTYEEYMRNKLKMNENCMNEIGTGN